MAARRNVSIPRAPDSGLRYGIARPGHVGPETWESAMSMTVGSNESRSYSEINMTSCTKSWRKRWQICSIAA